MTNKLYTAYHNMKQRCYNANRHDYKYYGLRGIKVCEHWLKSFNNFKIDMGPTFIDGLSLDRIDVNGNYCKENCRWISMSEQARNKRVYTNSNGEISGLSPHGNKWRARVYYKNNTYSIGVFCDKESAIIAIIDFKEKLKKDH